MSGAAAPACLPSCGFARLQSGIRLRREGCIRHKICVEMKGNNFRGSHALGSHLVDDRARFGASWLRTRLAGRRGILDRPGLRAPRATPRPRALLEPQPTDRCGSCRPVATAQIARRNAVTTKLRPRTECRRLSHGTLSLLQSPQRRKQPFGRRLRESGARGPLTGRSQACRNSLARSAFFCLTCASVQCRGALSGRQRRKLVPCRKRSPLKWS
jgi:hypothetical protein